MKVLVVGFGVSGRAAADFLKRKGYNVVFASDEIVNDEKLIQNDKLDRLFDGLSFIVVSPGVRLDLPFFKLAKKQKIEIIGELELAVRNMKGDIISVTGTNGKTTTVSLINFLLKDVERKVFLGGNVGVAATSFCDETTNDSISILECSSYQLESVKKFHSKISCILNFSVDHLARHKTMKRYIFCKQKIVKNQTKNDYLIINADNELLMQNIPKTAAKIFYFSLKKKVNGCYLKNKNIYFKEDIFEEKLVSIKNLKLVGEHNISNVLAACLSVYLETRNKNLLKDIDKFLAVPHRIEFVKTINKISFYNDSKATNIDSTIVALKSFDKEINLILGGSDKGYEFDDLFKNLPKTVKNIAIFGEIKQKIANSAKKFNFKDFQIFNSLKESTLYLFEVANKNSIVLLSPAAASFDCFSNYVERGNVFKKIVQEIEENEIFRTQNKSKNKVWLYNFFAYDFAGFDWFVVCLFSKFLFCRTLFWR